MSWLVLVESNTTGSGRLFCAAARRLGLRPVVLARDPGRYPYLELDAIETRTVATTDPAAVAAACDDLADRDGRGGRVGGVTSSSEYHVATAAGIARRRGLPHPDPDAIRACRDKATQRARLLAAAVPGARWASVGSPAEAVAAASLLGLPVVVKPIAGSGSIATRRCSTGDEVESAAEAALAAAAPQGAALVESYLTGTEYSVETFDDQVVGICRKHLGAEPHFVEVGHDFPAPLAPDVRADLATTALAALRALGLGWGPAHVELRHAPGDRPRIVEVNPRLAGGMIPRVVEEAAGIDLVLHTVARVAGIPCPVRPRASAAASIRFLVADRAGCLASIDGLAEARRLPHVIDVTATRRPGQPLPLTHSFEDRLAYVITKAPTPTTAAHAAHCALRSLTARIVPLSP
jgi:biotin carboxylase